MSKDMMIVNKKPQIVKEDIDEDAAKWYRGIHWAWFSLLMMIAIAALLLFAGVIKLNLGANSDEPLKSPYTDSGQ